MNPVGDGSDLVGEIWKLISCNIPVQSADTVYCPVDPHGKGGKVILIWDVLITGQQVQDMESRILCDSGVYGTVKTVMPGLDRSMNGIDNRLATTSSASPNIIISHSALEVRAESFLYLAQNQLHGYDNPVLFIEVDGAGSQSQGFHPSGRIPEPSILRWLAFMMVDFALYRLQPGLFDPGRG